MLKSKTSFGGSFQRRILGFHGKSARRLNKCREARQSSAESMLDQLVESHMEAEVDFFISTKPKLSPDHEWQSRHE